MKITNDGNLKEREIKSLAERKSHLINFPREEMHHILQKINHQIANLIMRTELFYIGCNRNIAQTKLNNVIQLI